MALSRALTGEAIGISSCTAEFISGAVQLEGVVSSTSSAVGALGKNSALAGASVAVSSGMGNLAPTHAITGQTAGVSSGTAALARLFPLPTSPPGKAC